MKKDRQIWFASGFLACMLLFAVYDIVKNGFLDNGCNCHCVACEVSR